MQNAHDVLRERLNSLRGIFGDHPLFDQVENLSKPYMVPVQGEQWIKFGLTEMQTRLANLLHTRLGKLVTHDNLCDAMWFDDPDGGKNANTLSVQLMHLRIALEGSYRIENVWGRGFIMHRVIPEERVEQVAA